ncbi:MAG: Hsp20/alpha crystallin family protein [Bacteroidaceae bacterium]|nr:Hsp20/alpha crystallin family protein [Bacteroidaceae bacterium]
MLPMFSNNYRNAMNFMPAFFNDFFNDSLPEMRQVHTTSPAINVTESDTDYKLDLAVPGTTKADYKINLTEDGNLMISLEKEQKKEDKGDEKRRWLRREFSYQKFSQAFTIPDDVERESISASVTDGVLTVVLPKKAKEALPSSKQIEVK